MTQIMNDGGLHRHYGVGGGASATLERLRAHFSKESRDGQDDDLGLFSLNVCARQPNNYDNNELYGVMLD